MIVRDATDMQLVALSIGIAMVAATLALWLAFNVTGLLSRSVASLLLAFAVCAMHYTGMGAANFVCTEVNRNAFPRGAGLVSSFGLSGLVITGAVMVAFLMSVSLLLQWMDRATARATARGVNKNIASGSAKTAV